jgi:glutathione S-transferase
MVLNYKRISYKTIALSYPEIAPTLSSLGIPLTPGGRYTLPAIQHPAPNPQDPPIVLMDSYAIAEFLETTYPDTPAIFPKQTEALQSCFLTWFMDQVFATSRPILIPLIPNIVDKGSIDHFRKTRKAVYGCELEEMEVRGTAREKVFERLEDAYRIVGAAIDRAGGIFLGGDRPIFADLALLGHLLWMKRTLLADEWDGVRKWHDGRWEKLLKSSEEFTQVL